MKISTFSPHHFLTSQWSGGSTTQLYIFPANASLSERNFELRLSTANVETAQSTFTSLPGIERKLMILEGEIVISHEGKHSRNLKPFEVDIFKGNWKTTAVGICKDFNLMTTADIKSDLYHLQLEAISDYILKPKNTCNKLFLYCASGSGQLKILNENHILKNEDLLAIEDFKNAPILITAFETFGIVVVEIY